MAGKPLLTVGLISGLVGCDAIQGVAKVDAEPPAASVSAAEAAAPVSAEEKEREKDGQLAEKLAKYIKCINYESKVVPRSRDYYLRDKDEKTGPTGKERYPAVPSKIEPNTCPKAVEEAKTMPPSLPEIEKAADAYVAALMALVPITKKAHDYYDQKDYKDDDFAAGKEMHGQLMAAYKKFEDANAPFESAVTKLNDEIAERRLRRLEKDPSAKLAYHKEKTVYDAKQLIEFVSTVNTLEELDAASYTPVLERFEKQVQALDAYVDGNPKEVSKVSGFKSFPSKPKAVLKAAKELMRRKSDNKDFNKESLSNNHPELVDGHPAQVIQKYNDMIQESNRLRI